MRLISSLNEQQQKIYACTMEDKYCTDNTMTALEELKAYLVDILRDAKYHCPEIHKDSANIASLVMELQSLSYYVHRFSDNLNRLLLPQEKSYCLDNTVFCEIQNFIKNKTKCLRELLPNKENAIFHSDWWGKTFKQLTQKIWGFSQRPMYLTPRQVLDVLTEICSTSFQHWHQAPLKKVQILDCLNRLYSWCKLQELPSKNVLNDIKIWLNAFDGKIVVHTHHIILADIYTMLLAEKNFHVSVEQLQIIRNLRDTVSILIEIRSPFSIIDRVQSVFTLLDNHIYALQQRADENGKIKREIFETLRKKLLDILKNFNTSSLQSRIIFSVLQEKLSECLRNNERILFSNRNALWHTGHLFKNTVAAIMTGFLYPCYTWYVAGRVFFPTHSSRTMYEINTLLQEILDRLAIAQEY
ncbi:MAG: hypothetical protein ACNA7Y_00555 [Gammaproteobacteria bacterium]